MFEYIHHVAYAVEDIDAAIGIFRDLFELEFVDRRVVEGDQSFEMATFRCGASIIELQRPINSPRVAQFLKDHGPGLLHVAYAVKNLPERVQQLREKGVFMKEPGAFVAGSGWLIANFDFGRTNLSLFDGPYYSDHLAEADPTHPPSVHRTEALGTE